MTSNVTLSPYQGACIAPFLDESYFPSTGGFVDARLCLEVHEIPGSPICCLPCPAAQWVYPDSFQTYNRAAEWISVFGLVLLVFMLISYAVLPTQKTRSHYLSVCLILTIGMLSLAFVVPLAANPEQCYNAITPNDMHSSLECAWSGAFLIAGGLSTGAWIAIRALSMNLQICWDIVPGRKFFWLSQLLGWGIPAALLAVNLVVTGVSFRFGTVCHVNHDNSLGTFWIPLMATVGVGGLLQLSTFVYCIRVYLKSLWGADAPMNSTNASSGGLPSYNNSLIRAQTARAVFQRLKKVLWLQWRGLGIVTIIIVDVVFFAVVLVYMDGLASDAYKDFNKIKPWVLCLASHPSDKDQCTELVKGWLLSESVIAAVLLLLSVSAIQCFLMLTRPSFFSAWADFFRRRFARRQEFVSLDAQADKVACVNPKQELLYYGQGHHSTTFEMQQPGHTSHNAPSSDSPDRHSLDFDSKSPDMYSSQVSSPVEAYKSPYMQERAPSLEWSQRQDGTSPVVTHPTPPPAAMHVSGRQHEQQVDYFQSAQHRVRNSTSTERHYNTPSYSFSAVRPPSRQSSTRSTAHDTRDFYGKGGLALNPPSEKGESQEDLVRGPLR